MTGRMSLRTLSVVVVAAAAVISSMSIARCAAEKPQNAADEPRYKNHRTTSNADGQNVASKTAAYPSAAQVQYVDASNAKDRETTEASEDAVRLFITPIGKRKPQQNQPFVAASTAAVRVQTSTAGAPAAAKNPTPPAYYVTAESAAVAVSKSPVYPPSRPIKDLTDVQTAAADDEPKRRSRFNGTAKSGGGAAAQDRAHMHLLYATTQPSAVGRVVASNASKPFATVIVPKKMLESVEYARGDDSSFRPMASSPFSYKPQQQQQQTAEHGASKRHGHVQQLPPQKTSSAASYWVEEYTVTEQPPFDRGLHNELQANNKPPQLQDRFGGATRYGPSDRQTSSEKSKQHEQVKRQENAIPVYEHAKYDASYGGGPAAVDTAFANENPYHPHKTAAADRHRDFYAQPSTADAPPSMVPRSPYDPAATASAGLYEMARSPYDVSLQHRPLHKETSAPWLPPRNAAATDARNHAEQSMAQDDANARDALKYLLRDVFKSKQHAEIKPKSSGMNEFIDAYFKTGRNNGDFSLDSYDIETDMSCNLRSTKYISDGQCVTTRPIVEAVCADRCLVYAPTLTSQRQRLSLTTNQQVEALHCVDGDVKFVRVQLKCRDGNAVNNVIKVVTNCRCKLHQIQPQMRSNSPVAIHNI